MKLIGIEIVLVLTVVDSGVSKSRLKRRLHYYEHEALPSFSLFRDHQRSRIIISNFVRLNV